jgi:O-antigen/teichoic acid export membrane protein
VPLLIPLFFGEAFIEAIPLAQILLIGAALTASRRILVEGLRGLGQPQASTFAEISMYPWLLTGGVFLVWHYGVMGLASGVAIGFFISLAMALWLAWGQQKAAITYSQRSEVGNSLS